MSKHLRFAAFDAVVALLWGVGVTTAVIAFFRGWLRFTIVMAIGSVPVVWWTYLAWDAYTDHVEAEREATIDALLQ